MSSLSGNLQRFGMEKVGKLESLQEIIAEMTETNEVNATGEAPFAHHQTGPADQESIPAQTRAEHHQENPTILTLTTGVLGNGI